jgi:hypothetical protein
MAVAFDAVGPGATGANGTSPLTWTHTASGTDRAVIVGVSQMNGAYTPGEVTATYGGASMTFLGAKASNDDVHGVAWLFGLVNPPTGAQTVSVQRSSGSYSFIGGSISFTGVDQTPFVANSAVVSFGDDSAGTDPPTVIVSSAIGDKVVDIAVDGVDLDGGPTHTSTNGQMWIRNVNSNTAAGNAAQSVYDGAASVTAEYNTTTGHDWWAMVAFNIKQVAAPAPTPIGIPGYAAFP